MKERPILFSAPMVRAILDGTKTQTRRVVKGQSPAWQTFTDEEDIDGNEFFVVCGDKQPDGLCPILSTARCPYGQPGDRLWVRETFLPWINTSDSSFSHVAAFKADGYELEPGERWKPAIHMPRAACRILLEVTGVRIERLNACTEADAWAEGIEACDGMLDDLKIIAAAKRMVLTIEDARATYAALWDSINGDGSWETNPFVWVITFRPLLPRHGSIQPP